MTSETDDGFYQEDIDKVHSELVAQWKDNPRTYTYPAPIGFLRRIAEEFVIRDNLIRDLSAALKEL